MFSRRTSSFRRSYQGNRLPRVRASLPAATASEAAGSVAGHDEAKMKKDAKTAAANEVLSTKY